MKTLIQPSVAQAAPPATDTGHGWPVLRLGFRPFYLGATLFACLSIPAWIVLFIGQTEWTPVIPPLLWHAHEMLFGFAAAVIMGFLMTAVKAWTGLSTPRGAALAALIGIWLAARIAATFGPYPVYAALDIVLLPAVAVILGRLLLRAGNRRNLPLVGLLGLLTVANLVFHLAMLGFLEVSAIRPLYAALALIVLIESVMGGRVIPAFTMNGVPGLRLKVDPLMEKATGVASVLALLLWIFLPNAIATALVLVGAAVLQMLRLASWKPWLTVHKPILWVLHLAYAWIPVGFLLLALGVVGWFPMSAGVHALAVGATGGLIIGMVTRTARGHTGRPLHASPMEVAAYALVFLAAIVRVVAPLVVPQYLIVSVIVASSAWALAFALYLALYTPWLMRVRLDGKDG